MRSLGIIISILLISLGLFGIGHYFYKDYAYKKKVTSTEEKKDQARNWNKELFDSCKSLKLEDRRDCFQEKLEDIRAKNPKVRTTYKALVDGKEVKVATEDETDLLKIERPKGHSFVRCSSNTFFFDWNETHVFLSLDNPNGAAQCLTPEGKAIYFVPSDMTDQELKIIKSQFGRIL